MQQLRQFSSLTRKFLALAILFLAVMLVWKIVLSPLVTAVEADLTELDDARFQRLRLEGLQDRPKIKNTAAMPEDTVLKTKNAEEAKSALTAYLSGLASSNDLEVESAEPSNGNRSGSIIAVELVLRGDEEKIARLINRAERSTPLVRFQSWKIDAGDTSEPGVLFSGRALAAWTSS